VLAADTSPEGGPIYAACLDGGIYEVDPDSGASTQIAKHDSYASGVRLLTRAQILISAGYDGVLQWHDLAERNRIRSVRAHRFWSWDLAVSPDEHLVASVTGQYRAGGYKYEPAPEEEPSVRVFDAGSGELLHSFSHVPPVLSVAFSPNGQFLAAANMMGEVRIWDLGTQTQAAQWTTPDFTSWGQIKSHHYIGGIFSTLFSPDGESLLVCGMGPMTDPMAGNGKQTWQRFAWRDNPPRKTGEIIDGERGNGLMETLVFHPNGRSFLMAGRLAQGKWNLAFFDRDSGKALHSADTKMRVTDATFSVHGTRLLLAGAVGQGNKKDGKYPEFGRLKIYQCGVPV
jgi:WD40 repeat protein